MSRSYKKHGILKDYSWWAKKYYNGVFRSQNKQRINQGKDPLQMKELVNQWDICDYKLHWREGMDWGWEDPCITRRRYFNK